jgi:hypothetical protein
VRCNAAFGDFAEVVPQMPAVRDLHRLGCAGGGCVDVERGAVPADHLDPRTRGQPRRDGARLPIGQQVDRPARLDVDHDGAVDTALPERKLVDPDHPRRCIRRIGKRMQNPQDRRTADPDADQIGEPGTRPASERQAKVDQHSSKAFSPAAVSTSQSRYLLDERATWTGCFVTSEPPHP